MFTLHWRTTSDPAGGSSSHVTLEEVFTAEAAKAVAIATETWFKLWIEDGATTYHWTEKTGI